MSRLEEARAELEKLENEIYLCSLGDRPMNPGVERLQRARDLRSEIDALKRLQAEAVSQ